MSVNDLASMDLIPLIIIISIIGIIFLIYYNFSYKQAKDNFSNSVENEAKNVKVVSKELGDLINIGGTLAAPIKGYRCTIVFENRDGSRIVLKTSKNDIYERIVVGDIANIKYKEQIILSYDNIKQ